MPALANGIYGGVTPPPFQSGKYYWPQHVIPITGPITITANILYRMWMYVAETTTFSGGWFYNNGTGDNGKKIRIGVWDRSGALLKDFGEKTLNASAALRAVANSVTIPGGSLVQVGLVSDTAPVLRGVCSIMFQSAAGTAAPNILANQLGVFPAALFLSGGASNMPIGDTASFVYAALPSPITTATASITNSNNTDISGSLFPAMGLYV